METKDSKIILYCFAGRKKYMEIQIKYIVKLLEKYDYIKYYDIWDFSWNQDDSKYLHTLVDLHPKIRIRHAPNFGQAMRDSPVSSRQIGYLFTDGYPYSEYNDYYFVKIDDDIVFVDINNFEKYINKVINSPEYFLISADVINNDMNKENIAESLHKTFLNEGPSKDEIYEEPFSNENRLSINFVAYSGKDLNYIYSEFGNKLGADDEWRLCHKVAKRLNRQNLIIKNYNVVHFSFGSQRGKFNEDVFLSKYKQFQHL